MDTLSEASKIFHFWGVSQNIISVDHDMLHFGCFGCFHVGEYMITANSERYGTCLANSGRYEGFLANSRRYGTFLANSQRYGAFLANSKRYGAFLANSQRYGTPGFSR